MPLPLYCVLLMEGIRDMNLRLLLLDGGLWILECSLPVHSTSFLKFGIPILLKYIPTNNNLTIQDVSTFSFNAKIYSHSASPLPVHTLIACTTLYKRTNFWRNRTPNNPSPRSPFRRIHPIPFRPPIRLRNTGTMVSY